MAGSRSMAQAPDSWITNQAQFPNGAILAPAPKDSFKDLHAEVLAGNLKVVCSLPANSSVTLYASADPSGHWPARHWQIFRMAQNGPRYQGTVPVIDPDIPVAYFIRVSETSSPLRLCHPRELGLQEPSGHFWPFLDGFEQGLTAWYLLSPAPSLQTAPLPKNGRAALLVKLPPEQHSVTIATTLLRGWQLKQHAALGVRLWLRTETGSARARYGVLGNAFTPHQSVQTWPDLTTFGPTWQKVDLYFAELPKLDLVDVDLFTIEFIAQGPCGFLLDDVELLVKE